jgi:hypothetical protein
VVTKEQDEILCHNARPVQRKSYLSFVNQYIHVLSSSDAPIFRITVFYKRISILYTAHGIFTPSNALP